MKCTDCIYYKSGALENECLLHGYLNFRADYDCDLVDNNFNQLKDDIGNDCFMEVSEVINNMEKRVYPYKHDIEIIKKKLIEVGEL